MKGKDEELLKAEAVAGIPDKVLSQIAETQVHAYIYMHILNSQAPTPPYREQA